MRLEVVDREREIGELRRLAAHPPALVIVRGRRRIGKTFLLRVAFAGPRVVYLQAEEQPRPLQLEAFAEECRRLVPGNPPLSFRDWGEAFRFVEDQADRGGPLIVILDEFQYLAASDPGIVSTIQRSWDRWDAHRTQVMLVLSGSALSFMEGLLAVSSPAFGRSVFRPLLLPLTYRDSAAFAPGGTSPDRLIERFAVVGGTPQYQVWAGRRPLGRVIAETILPPGAPLHNEPEHLVRQEEKIREPGPYLGTLRAIAEGYGSTSAIAARLEMKQQLASQFLARLEALGYVVRAEPLEPGRRGAKRGYWRIADPYLRFWFRYVLPNRSRLARGRITEVAQEIRQDLATFVGPVFEECCREWVARYSALGAAALEVGSWWSRTHDLEIDVVTVERSGYGLLGSCKWSRRPVGERVLDALYAAKAALGPKAGRARLAIFSRAGFSPALRERAAREGVALVEVADLFR
ncbi:MAG TPA: ATP-binding protein [Actinomycetota bacterium]|nr:ATP-binding protein [Actinomycetota bacterium]